MKKNNTKTAYFSFLSILFILIIIYQWSAQVVLDSESEKSDNDRSKNIERKIAEEITNKTLAQVPPTQNLSQQENANSPPLTVKADRVFDKILAQAELKKIYKFKGSDVKVYKKKRGNFHWVRVIQKANELPMMTRADQLLIRVTDSGEVPLLEEWMQEQEPSFKLTPFMDGLYFATFSADQSLLKYEEISELLKNKSEWVLSVSDDFVYTR